MLFNSSKNVIDANLSASARLLIDWHAASKLYSKDPTLYAFSKEAMDFASNFMGWTTLCSAPPFDPQKIADFAAQKRKDGLTDVFLLGQGGSSQAAMTMADVLKKCGRLDINFHTIDCLSPEFVLSELKRANLEKSLVIVSSKSGSTIEPLSVFKCVWKYFQDALGGGDVDVQESGDEHVRTERACDKHTCGEHFVAITDPNTPLEALARKLNFAAIFSGEKTVGGRFSALSVFGLVPFALMGMDVCELTQKCARVEELCGQDSLDNPAIGLAGFIKDFNLIGRDKLIFKFDKNIEAMSYWLEQLIAESTGKDGRGVFPTTETDMRVIANKTADNTDKMAIVYSMTDESNSKAAMESEIDFEVIRKVLPSIRLSVDSPEDVCAHFIVWEYAIAMFCALTGVNPFDQPNVESTKKAVRELLSVSKSTQSSIGVCEFMNSIDSSFVLGCDASAELLDGKSSPQDLDDALGIFMSSIKNGDYISINAFLPTCKDRTEQLDAMRRDIAKSSGRPTALEMGPRYLHSIGQYQKGGANRGVFLILSAEDCEKLNIPEDDFDLGYLATVQACGDYKALKNAMRRVLHLHLCDSSPQTLEQLKDKIARHLPR